MSSGRRGWSTRTTGRTPSPARPRSPVDGCSCRRSGARWSRSTPAAARSSGATRPRVPDRCEARTRAGARAAMIVRVRIERDGAERSIDVEERAITIGRAAGQTVRIVDDDLAPEHAAIEGWELVARAAMTVDGVAITAGARRTIASGAK